MMTVMMRVMVLMMVMMRVMVMMMIMMMIEIMIAVHLSRASLTEWPNPESAPSFVYSSQGGAGYPFL
jgi:hypothetical protein